MNTETNDTATLLRPAEKAKELRITLKTLANWRKRGRVKSVTYSPRCFRYFPGLA